MAKISILVPVYNVENYLRECIESICSQTFKDIEIICMDDGSTDLSGEILDEYAQKDDRIKVIHKENTGYGHTMNQALQLASGEYIGFVESDDYIASNMYEVMYKTVKKYDLDFVKTDYYAIWNREDGSRLFQYQKLGKNERLYNRVLEPNMELEAYFLEKFTWNALYKREYIRKNYICHNETPGASYQDNGFWFQTFYHAKRVMFLNEAFYYYTQNNPNSSINSPQKVYAMKNEYDFIRNFLKGKAEKIKDFYKICFHFRMCGYMFTLYRIAEEYKLEFSKVIQKEIYEYEKLQEINFEFFDEEQKKWIEQLRNNPEEYVRNLVEGKDRVRRCIEGFSHIVVYGAGNYGKMVFNCLNGSKAGNVRLHLAVTDLQGKKEYYHSFVVKELKDFIEEKEECLVVLSVSKNSEAYMQMRNNLNKLGFKNVKSYLDIL